MSMIGHLLNRTLVVHRREDTPDGSGGFHTTWPVVGEVAARVAQPNAADRYAAMQAGATLDAQVYTNPGAGVVRGDELRGGGESYRVIATVYPSEPGVYLRADCERFQREGDP